MLPRAMTPAQKQTVEDHFSPMEDALFRELDEDAELDAFLDRAFDFLQGGPAR